MEEFTLRFLDPLKFHEDNRTVFCHDLRTNVILETATNLEQKKVIRGNKRLFSVNNCSVEGIRLPFSLVKCHLEFSQ